MKDTLHSFWVGYEVGGEITPIKLHSFYHLQSCLQALCLFYGDDPLLAHLVHCLCDDVAYSTVIVGCNGTYLSDLLGVFSRFGRVLEFLSHCRGRLVNPPFEGHGVMASRYHFDTLSEDLAG